MNLPIEVSDYFQTYYPNQHIDVKYCRQYGNMNVVDFTISDMFFRTVYIPVNSMSKSKLDEYLDLMRDTYNHSVYKCRECGFRAFGRPVTVHEMQLNHVMVKEEPH